MMMNTSQTYSDSGYDIRIFSSPEDFKPYHKAWDQTLLKYQFPSLHVSASYLSAMWRNYPDLDGALIMIEKEGTPIALAPLAHIRYKYRGLSLKSMGPLDFMRSGRSDIPVIRDVEKIAPLLREITRRMGADLWHLDRLPVNSPVYQYFSAGQANQIDTYENYELAIIETSQNWEAFLSSKSKNFRKNFRRIEEASKDLTQVFITDQEKEWPVFIEHMLSIMKRTWKSDNNSSFADDERRIGFFRDLIMEYGPQNKFVGALLFDKDLPVAFTFGLIFEDTLYAMETSYISDYAHTSAGIKSYTMIMKYAFDRKDIKICDMDTIRDHGAYKKRWATQRPSQISALILNGGIGSVTIRSGKFVANIKAKLDRGNKTVSSPV